MTHAIQYTDEALEKIITLQRKARLNLIEKILLTSYRWRGCTVEVTYQPDGDYGLTVKQDGQLKIYICAILVGAEVSLHS